MKKCLLFLSAAVLSLCFWLPGSYAQAAGNPVIRIGLFYGSNGLPAANLQNVSGKGSGYSLGFYNQDAGNSFVPLMQVSQTEITVVKDKLIYISGEKDYSDVATASYRAVIAPYHLQTDRSFGTWQQAQEFSQSLGQDAFPAYVNGAYVVRIGQYRSAAEAQAEAETVAAQAGAVTAAGGSETCYTVTVTGESTILFELDMGGTPLGIQPQGTDVQTWFKGNTYYGGFQYDRVNGNDLTVVNMVKLDDYVKGVVPYEMSPSWPVEALKAQALCARNYAVNSQGKHASQGFDLCNTTDCQVYQGTASANANSDRAVEDTSGQYILYNGEIAEVFYHASSGGSTEDSENIWSAAVPYLRGVEDTYLTNPIQWSATLTCEQAAQILRDKGYSVSGVTDIYVSQTSSHGNVIGLTVERQGDSPLVFSKEQARTILNSSSQGVSILSHRYTISGSGGGGGSGSIAINDQMVNSLDGLYAIGSGGKIAELDSGGITVITGSGQQSLETMTRTANASGSGGTFTITGTGNGHHIGLSQWGANGMAAADFSYQDIIKFYFTGVQVGPA